MFPGSSGLTDREHWVLPTEIYDGTERQTLTLPVLAAAHNILFLVSGGSKSEVLRRILSEKKGVADHTLPARLLLDMIAVKQKAGWERPSVYWIIDRDAAAVLPERLLQGSRDPARLRASPPCLTAARRLGRVRGGGTASDS